MYQNSDDHSGMTISQLVNGARGFLQREKAGALPMAAIFEKHFTPGERIMIFASEVGGFSPTLCSAYQTLEPMQLASLEGFANAQAAEATFAVLNKEVAQLLRRHITYVGPAVRERKAFANNPIVALGSARRLIVGTVIP